MWTGGNPPRLGLSRTRAWPMAKPETREAIAAAVRKLVDAGVEVVDIALPDVFERALDAFGVISTLDAPSCA